MDKKTIDLAKFGSRKDGWDKRILPERLGDWNLEVTLNVTYNKTSLLKNQAVTSAISVDSFFDFLESASADLLSLESSLTSLGYFRGAVASASPHCSSYKPSNA